MQGKMLYDLPKDFGLIKKIDLVYDFFIRNDNH